MVHRGAMSCRVVVEFELGAERYRVERQRSLSGNGKSSLTLFRLAEDPIHPAAGPSGTIWDPIGGATIAETQEAIEQLLGMDAALWLGSSFLGQGDADNFTRATPAERKTLLAEVLQLGRYQELHEGAKARESALATEAATLQRKAEELEDFLAGEDEAAAKRSEAELIHGSALKKLSTLESQLKETQRFLEKARERAAQVVTLRERLSHQQQTRERDLARDREDLATVEGERERLEREAAAVATEAERCRQAERMATELVAQALVDREGALARRSDAEHKTQGAEQAQLQAHIALQKANARQEDLRKAEEQIRILTRAPGEISTCPACEQSLSAGHRDGLIQRLERDAGEAKEQVGALSGESDKWGREAKRTREESARLAGEAADLERKAGEAERAAERARADADRANGVTEQAGNLRARLSALGERAEHLRGQLEKLGRPSAEEERLAAEIRESAPAAGELERLAGEVRAREADVANARQEATRAATELARAEEALARYSEARKALEASQARHDELVGERFRWGLLVEAFGRNGIPALVVENAIPQIEEEANRFLVAFFPGLSVTLESQRATKAGDIRETLDFVVSAGGDARQLETYSGGERQAVDLALRIGLARLLAHRAGRPIECLIVDEGFGTFDQGRRQEAVRVLHALVEEFPRILFVTHDQELADAFPARIEVTREDGSSRVRIVGLAEAAA